MSTITQDSNIATLFFFGGERGGVILKIVFISIIDT